MCEVFLQAMRLNALAVAALFEKADYAQAAKLFIEALTLVERSLTDQDAMMYLLLDDDERLAMDESQQGLVLEEEEDEDDDEEEGSEHSHHQQQQQQHLGSISEDLIQLFPVCVPPSQHQTNYIQSRSSTSSKSKNNSNNGKDDNTNTGFVLYNRVFILAPPQGHSELNVTNNAKINNHLRVILLYNLGLTFQLQGLNDMTAQHASLEESRDMYMTAVGLMDNTLDDPSSVLLNLALYDNLVHLYAYCMELEDAARCVSHIRMCIKDAEVIARYIASPHEGEFAHFKRNLMVGETLRSQASPAA